MSDEEEYSEEEEEEEEEAVKEPTPPPPEPKISKADLEEMIRKEIAEWRAQRAREEEILKKLKEKVAKRKVLRQAEEERLEEERRREEEERQRLIEEKKQREQEEKMRRIQEALRKKQEAQQKREAGKKIQITKKGGGAHFEPGSLREELAKTPEQREQEKQMQLEFRIPPLKDMSDMTKEEKKAYALELWDRIVTIVTETYDMQEHQKTQDYDLKELKERHRQKLRQKALKLGLEPEALTGKYPPKIQVACKYERREDTRTYEDKKKLFEGGIDVIEKEIREKHWKERQEEFQSRIRVKLPKWFGERPGRKKGDPPTPEDVKPDDDDDDDLLLQPPTLGEEGAEGGGEGGGDGGGGDGDGGGGGEEGGGEEGEEEEEEEE